MNELSYEAAEYVDECSMNMDLMEIVDGDISDQGVKISPTDREWRWQHDMTQPGEPESVYHNREFILALPRYADMETINDDLYGSHSALLEAVYDGYSEEFDGQNFKGQLNEHGSASLVALQEALWETTFDDDEVLDWSPQSCDPCLWIDIKLTRSTTEAEILAAMEVTGASYKLVLNHDAGYEDLVSTVRRLAEVGG